MPELDLNQVEEVPVNTLPFPIPPVETLIKQAAINVMKGRDQNNNEAVMLQFITPGMVYSIQLDTSAAKAMSDELRPSGIEIARASDLPKV